MSQDTDQPTTDLAISIERPASTAVMTVEQFDSTWRMSKALAASRSFKDIGPDDASKALARILLGADLGMSPTQSLMGIDIVKGNPQIRGVALGRMVRNTARHPLPLTGESYDYKVLDRGFEPGAEYAVVALYRRDEDGKWPIVEDDEGETFPTSVGPITIAKGKRLPEDVEAFKLDQALKRNLVKDDGAWQTQPEVMVVWRALSQLVRFYAPDVIGGVPVYTEADSFAATAAEQVGDSAEPAVLPLPANVEAVIARAKAVGHVDYSNRARIGMEVGGQPDEFVEAWCVTAIEGMAAMPVIADVVVVEGTPQNDAVDEALSDLMDPNAAAAGLRADAQQLRDEIEGLSADDPRDPEEMRREADELDRRADGLDGTQGALL